MPYILQTAPTYAEHQISSIQVMKFCYVTIPNTSFSCWSEARKMPVWEQRWELNLYLAPLRNKGLGNSILEESKKRITALCCY